MRSRARTLLIGAAAAHVVLACSLITDYALESKQTQPPAPNDSGGTDGTTEPPTDSSTFEDVSVVDADPGPMCTATPCVVQVAAAVQNTCARLDTGVVKCWGWNNTGAVGAAVQNADFATPQTVALDGPADEIALGGWPGDYPTACARRGTIVDCWGADGSGRMLGRGAASTASSFNPTPGPVANLTNAAGGIAIGGIRVCARTAGDTLACWADDYTGKNNTWITQDAATPFPTPSPVKQIAGGRSQHCALYDSEDVACFGNNDWYEPLWNAPDSGRGPGSTTPQVVGGVTGIVQVVSQTNHTCALKKTGVVLCWGRNKRGELGRGTTSDKEATPAQVTLQRPAKHIGVGAGHTCAILDDDTVWCWGSNGLNGWDSPRKPRGQIGIGPDGGADNGSSLPRKVEGLPAGVKRSVVGGYAHTCVLMQDGSVYCFGANNHGQLGLGPIDGGQKDDLPHPTPSKVMF